jgi:hypothetical protein
LKKFPLGGEVFFLFFSEFFIPHLLPGPD